MGTRTSHAPGTFSWVDLSTSDQEAGKRFYGDLFGWEFEDLPVGDGATYSMASVDGENVAAVSGQQPGDPSPPHWNNYVTVEDASATAAKVQENGGNVLMEAFDVLDSGRMAVLQDPTGGIFAVWEPRNHIGAGRVNEPGALTWNELGTPDPSTAESFYTGVFGWGTESMDTGGGPAYTVISVDGRSNGGIREQSPEEQEGGVPANWLPYFAVDSVDETLAKAGELGATVLLPPMDMPNDGRIAALADPQGAAFALWQGPLDD